MLIIFWYFISGTFSHNTQHKDDSDNDIQHTDTHQQGLVCDTQHKRNSTIPDCHAECHFAECSILFFVMLNVIMISVIMLSVMAL